MNSRHLNRTAPFSMLTVQIESGPYVAGILRLGDMLWALDPEGNKAGEGTVKKMFGRRGV